MISARYVPATCLLLALALVPTLIHSYAEPPAPATRVITAVPSALAGYQSTPSPRSATWGMRRFGTNDWVEREYTTTNPRDRVTLTVVRSFDSKSLYHHPELAVADGTAFAGEEVLALPQRPEIPVHVLTAAPGVRAAAMYVLHYDTRFIDNPVVFQLRTAGELLFSRRKPMTLFFVGGEQPLERDDLGRSSALRLLFASIDAFLQV